MTGLLRGELRKLVFRPTSLLALAIVAAVVACSLFVPRAERLDLLIDYIPLALLASSALLVGDIVSSEYDSRTLKELVLSAPSRSAVYLAKLLTSLAAISALFAFYTALLVAACRPDAVGQIGGLFVNQLLALAQHVLVLFNLAFFLRSFAGLGATTIVFLLVYRQLAVHPGPGLLGETFFVQFARFDGIASTAAACAGLACASCAIGFLWFRRQDVS